MHKFQSTSPNFRDGGPKDPRLSLCVVVLSLRHTIYRFPSKGEQGPIVQMWVKVAPTCFAFS